MAILSLDGATIDQVPETLSLAVDAGDVIFLSVHSYGLTAGDAGTYELDLVLP